MNAFKVFTIKKGLLEDNARVAEETRNELRQQGVYLMNIMSSPGSGKTTMLVHTIEALKKEIAIGVLEADIDSDVDAATVEKAGAKAIQLHTGGLCHLDATMTKQGIDELGVAALDLVFLENIGNLICPAGYDTGAMKNIALLSVPEGDDKPLKYPKIFGKVDALVVTKLDVLPYFDFDLERLEKRVRALNPEIEIFAVSAKTGEGMTTWVNWIKQQMNGEA